MDNYRKLELLEDMGYIIDGATGPTDAYNGVHDLLLDEMALLTFAELLFDLLACGTTAEMLQVIESYGEDLVV